MAVEVREGIAEAEVGADEGGDLVADRTVVKAQCLTYMPMRNFLLFHEKKVEETKMTGLRLVPGNLN